MFYFLNCQTNEQSSECPNVAIYLPLLATSGVKEKIYLPLLATLLTFKGDWFTARNRYSANDSKELPAVGSHFLEVGCGLTKFLNCAADSFWKALKAEVESLLIILNVGEEKTDQKNKKHSTLFIVVQMHASARYLAQPFYHRLPAWRDNGGAMG